jgi:hypothetical protein
MSTLMRRRLLLPLVLSLFACHAGPREGLRIVLDASPDAIPVLRARLDRLHLSARVDVDPAGGVRVDLPPLGDVEAVKGVLLRPGVLTLRPEVGEPLELRHVESATARFDPMMGAMVQVSLDPAAAKAFAVMTAANVHKKIALVVDGKVIVEPIVQEAITVGKLQLTLGRREGGAEEQIAAANALAATLSGGALPGTVTVKSAATFKE